jgi:hypothetical protein
MAYAIVKTEHNGPKRGKGAWMRKKDAKVASSKVRRRQAQILSKEN